MLSENNRGIPHIEDLPPFDFITLIKNIHLCTATEKIDGSQILFGLDDTGFYTSRETKGGRRFYRESDYEISFSTTFQRAAHKALESVLFNLITGGLCVGDQIEAEVLFGEIPNVVPYSNATNYIVLLRTTSGSVNIHRLANHLHGLTNIQLSVPHTDDGITTYIKEQTTIWAFKEVPITELPEISKKVLTLLEDFESYLMSYSGVDCLTNGQLECLPMNRIPAGMDSLTWRNSKADIKHQRQLVRGDCYISKYNIKNYLLNLLVRNRSSQFGQPVSSGGWIEGIVLSSTQLGLSVKLVDKDMFGVARISAWEVRNRLNYSKFAINIRNNPNLCELEYSRLKEDLDKYTKEKKYTGAIDRRTKEVYASMFGVISEVRSSRLLYSNK